MTRTARPLLVVGSGGFARETVEAVRAGAAFDVLGYLDDDASRHGRALAGVPVLGPVDVAADHPDAAIVLATGRPADYGSRRRLADRLGLPAERYARVVHPAAVIGGSCRLGAGTVVLAGAVLTADVQVGSHVAVMPHVVLTHDDDVRDFVTLASGVRLGGGVRVEENAYLGAGALVREQRRVGAWALVGMGAVVTTDVPAGEVWVGNPARRLRPVARAAS